MVFFELRYRYGAMKCCVASLVLVHQRASRGLGGFMKKKSEAHGCGLDMTWTTEKNHEPLARIL